MTTSTPTDTAKYLTLVYCITSPAQQTRLLAEGRWVASAHSNALAERDALRNEVAQLEPLLQEAAAIARENRSRVVELEVENARLQQMLDAVGAGGVEPLRRAKCLHQIVEPSAVAQEPVAWRTEKFEKFMRHYKYTDIGLQVEAWKNQGLKIEPLYAVPQPPAAAHPDDAAVDALAVLMKAKLAKQRKKGYGGWETPECTQRRLSALLRGHIDKGDPVDVANFCAFLSARGEGIAPLSPAPVQGPVPTLLAAHKAVWLPANDTEGGAV